MRFAGPAHACCRASSAGGRGRYVGAAPEGGQSGKEQTSRICITESDGANSVNRPVIIASYTAIYICVPMPTHWAHVQGWSQVMYETDAGAIPHAHKTGNADGHSRNGRTRGLGRVSYCLVGAIPCLSAGPDSAEDGFSRLVL